MNGMATNQPQSTFQDERKPVAAEGLAAASPGYAALQRLTTARA